MGYNVYDLMLIFCDQNLVDSHDCIVSPSYSFGGLIKSNRLAAFQLSMLITIMYLDLR